MEKYFKDLYPSKNQVIRSVIDNEYLSEGTNYTIKASFYKIISYDQVLIEDDTGIERWVPLVYFNWMSE